MTRPAQPLPMAPSGCALDDTQLAEQLGRYRHLSGSVLGIDRDGQTARIVFSERVETELVQNALAIERSCCSFFTLDYDASQRALTITTDQEHAGSLSVLLSALTPAPAAILKRDSA
jgi:xanthine/CO dehydrogenase XdhC/CoxF family maturation factor